MRQAPDYVAVGPVFSSGTKPELTVRGPALLISLAAMGRMPLVAIGGITPDRLAEIPLRLGVQIAVCQAVIGAADPRKAAQELKRRMTDQADAVGG